MLTFTDELARRGGSVDIKALSRALGVRVIPIVAGDRAGVEEVSEALSEVDSWPAPIVAPPIGQSDVFSWSASVLEAAHYQAAGTDRRSHGIDRVQLIAHYVQEQTITWQDLVNKMHGMSFIKLQNCNVSVKMAQRDRKSVV